MSDKHDSLNRVGAIFDIDTVKTSETEINKYLEYGKTYARLIHDISNPLTAALVLAQTQTETAFHTPQKYTGI